MQPGSLPLRRVLAAALFLAGTMAHAPVAAAKPFPLQTLDNAMGVIRVPDQWAVKATKTGIQATSPDQGVRMAVIAVEAEDVENVVTKGLILFAMHGTDLDTKPTRTRNYLLGGAAAREMVFSGRGEAGPVTVNLTLVTVGGGRYVVIGCEATPKGAEANAKDIAGIFDSYEPAQRVSSR